MAELAPSPRRLAALALLWTVVSLSAFLTLVQVALVVFTPGGEWQTPDFYQAEVVFVDRATRTAFTEDVQTTVDGETLTLTLPRTEADALRPHQVVWILDDRLYNRRKLRPAESLVRTFPSYYATLRKQTTPIFYDQFEVLINQKRLKKGHKLRVHLQRPYPIPEKTCQIH